MMKPILISEASFIGFIVPSDGLISSNNVSCTVDKSSFYCCSGDYSIISSEFSNVNLTSNCFISCLSLYSSLVSVVHSNVFSFNRNLFQLSHDYLFANADFGFTELKSPIYSCNVSSCKLLASSNVFSFGKTDVVIYNSLFQDITAANLFAGKYSITVYNSIFQSSTIRNLLDPVYMNSTLTMINCQFSDIPKNNSQIIIINPIYLSQGFDVIDTLSICYGIQNQKVQIANDETQRITYLFELLIEIRNCIFSGMSSYSSGSCIHLESVISSTISSSVFTNCFCSQKGGVIFAESCPIINLWTVCSQNCSSFVGTFIYSNSQIGKGQFDLLSVETNQNTSILYSSNFLNIESSNFSKNSCYSAGQAIHALNINLDRCVFDNNLGMCLAHSQSNINHTYFVNNHFPIFFSRFIIENCFFSNNTGFKFDLNNHTKIKNCFVDQSDTSGFRDILPLGTMDLSIPIIHCYTKNIKDLTIVIAVSVSIAALIVTVIPLIIIITFLKRKSNQQEKKLLLEKSLIADFG